MLWTVTVLENRIAWRTLPDAFVRSTGREQRVQEVSLLLPERHEIIVGTFSSNLLCLGCRVAVELHQAWHQVWEHSSFTQNGAEGQRSSLAAHKHSIDTKGRIAVCANKHKQQYAIRPSFRSKKRSRTLRIDQELGIA
jgi:hypothetical protein